MPPAFNCPRCHALTGQETAELWVYAADKSLVQVHDGETTVGWMGEQEATRSWEVTKCFSCKKHSLWIFGNLAYPTAPHELGEMTPPNEDLPEDVLELYNEAVAVLPHSKRAAAALCRAALDRLAWHLTPTLPPAVKLDGRLVALAESVSSPTLQALNIVRHTGNTALHGEKDGDQSAVIYLDESDGTISDVFFVAINALADELITRPKYIDALYQSLPDGVRQSFEAKTAKAS